MQYVLISVCICHYLLCTVSLPSLSSEETPNNSNRPASTPKATSPGIYLEKFVLFAQVHRLFPAVVALIEVGGNATEFNQLMLLKALRQGDVVEVVIGIDGGTQALVVLLLNKQVVEGLVDGLVVVLLY